MTDVNPLNPVKLTRKERAASTRRRIAEAATAEFIASGYHGTSMAAIARRAGVAVQTVYFVFHTKPELFAAALDSAVLGPEGRPPLEQAWARDAAAHPDGPNAAIAAFVRGSGPIFLRASALSEVARAAAPTDPELAAVWGWREKLRVDGYRDFLAALQERLPEHVDGSLAGDVLIAMLSPGFYLSLRVERGWPHEQVIEWMAGAIPHLMLGM